MSNTLNLSQNPNLDSYRVKVVAVKDRAVNAFLAPMTVTHVGTAKRSFADAINRPKDPTLGGADFASKPDDFDLYFLGEFNPTTGSFYPTESGQPELLDRGVDVLVVRN